MSVITFSREPCSGGTEIAQTVAQALGYRFATKQTIEQVLLQYGFSDVAEAYDSVPNFWTRFDDRTHEIVRMFDRVVMALARIGNVVIVGRGAFKVLASYHDVLNVRIKAPFSTRVRTYMQRYNVHDRKEAENAVLEADRARSAFLDIYYGVKMDSMAPFDLVINTGKVPARVAAPMIIEANKAIMSTICEPHESTSSIQVDNVLLETTRKSVGITKL